MKCEHFSFFHPETLGYSVPYKPDTSVADRTLKVVTNYQEHNSSLYWDQYDSQSSEHISFQCPCPEYVPIMVSQSA